MATGTHHHHAPPATHRTFCDPIHPIRSFKADKRASRCEWGALLGQLPTDRRSGGYR